MKITKITIENYKSIKHLALIPNSGINTIIGENSVGKSNIFDAINWLLGPVYPSFNSTTKQDHWQGNFENEISIRLDYDDGNYLELAETWHYRSYKKSGLNLSGNYVNTEQREKYCSAYLGVDRQIQDYLPSNRWTLIGRILQQINSTFLCEKHLHNGKQIDKKDHLKNKLTEIRDDILFSVGRTTGESKDGLMDKFMSILQKESAKQLNRAENSFSIDLTLYDPWNFYRTLQLLVNEPDMDMQFQASSLGMGVQASITIAILKAYAELNLPNKTPIFIDEPELFLHPHAQINFYNLLREMSQDKVDENGEIHEGIQIFYTTHSPNFIRTDYFDELFITRKTKALGTFCCSAKISDFITDLQIRKTIESSDEEMRLHFKNAYENTGDSQRANEAFFAKKIILVEGQSESLILPYFFQLLGYDFIKEGISIVRCGCKSELDRFFRLYNEFSIPCYIIFDGDKQHAGTKDEATSIQRNHDILNLFGVSQDWPDGKVYERFLGFTTCMDNNLGFRCSADKKSLSLFIEVKKHISDDSKVPAWVNLLLSKITLLKNPVPHLLKKPQRILSRRIQP